MTLYTFEKAAADSGNTLASWVVAMEKTVDAGRTSDFTLAQLCTDLCMEQVAGRTLMGCSPSALASGNSSFEYDCGSSEDEDGPEEVGECTGAQAQWQPRQKGFIYCCGCDKWLNGFTQWADHVRGAKHQNKGSPSARPVPPEDGVENSQESSLSPAEEAPIGMFEIEEQSFPSQAPVSEGVHCPQPFGLYYDPDRDTWIEGVVIPLGSIQASYW